MPDERVGNMPQFDTDETVQADEPIEQAEEEVKEAEVDEILEEGKENPTEPPADETPGDEIADDAGKSNDLEKQVTGLQEERAKLLKEIQDLRGTRREIKQAELITVNKQLDDLKDLHPADVQLIDRILKAKGYLTKEESNKMFYDAVKQEELNKFLDQYPEYKPENDPNDLNWSALQRELGYYRMPEDPHKILDVLNRAHKAVAREPSGRGSAATVRRIETASHGSGGTQRSSSKSSAGNERIKALLSQHTDLSDEEIAELEKEL